MHRIYRFYIDDSGSREPDRNPRDGVRENDWYSLGGLIIDEADKDSAECSIAAFRGKWPEVNGAALRSYDIRNECRGFSWLRTASVRRRNLFFDDLNALIADLPIYVLACVVDRPGYNARYVQKYGRERWKLCRTAFMIIMERAAKFTLFKNARMRVLVERSDPKTDNALKGYFNELREKGLPFDQSNSAKYQPLPTEQLRLALLEFALRDKQSDLMQIADLVLFPVSNGGYRVDRSHQLLHRSGKLLDCICTPENSLLGVKYSCWELVEQRRKNKSP